MRAVVQRVKRCRVMVDGDSIGQIGLGLLVLLGVGKEDTEVAADYLAEKIIGLRICLGDIDIRISLPCVLPERSNSFGYDTMSKPDCGAGSCRRHRGSAFAHAVAHTYFHLFWVGLKSHVRLRFIAFPVLNVKCQVMKGVSWAECLYLDEHGKQE